MAGDNGDNQRCADTSKAIKLEVVLDTDTAAGHTIGVTKGGEWARRQQEVVGNNFYISMYVHILISALLAPPPLLIIYNYTFSFLNSFLSFSQE